MIKFVKRYNECMSLFGVLCLAGFITSVLIQVISRTFLPKSPSWTEEAARYLFIYMIAFGCSVAVHKKEYVGVDMITSALPPLLNKILSGAIQVAILGFCTYLMFQSVLSFALIKYRMVSTAMQLPMQYVYFSMVLLFGMLILSYLFELVLMVTHQTED